MRSPAIITMPVDVRTKRAQDVIKVLLNLQGGAKLTSHLTDVSPKFIVLAAIDGGNHIFMYYLKKEKGIQNILGFIDYPKLRKKEKVELTESEEKFLEDVIEGINSVVQGNIPKPDKKRICRKCAYYEFCWV